MLPDVGGLSSLSSESWRSLRDRLRAIGVDSQTLGPHVARAARAESPLRAPIVKWHLRREREPSAYAMRMFLFWDAVTVDEAREALGPALPLERMLEIGLLSRTDEGTVVSPIAMKIVSIAGDDLYLFSDDLTLGHEAVMGASPATLVLAGFARPRARTANALDVGCGAGTLALAMASMCDRVVATDISPRAIALARVNAWMNGIDNVEFRLGDLMTPVVGESFDLIVSQPPFVPWPEELPATEFLFGGRRGDELALRLLAQLTGHLAPGGMAITMVDWPIVEGDPALLPRLREAVGPSEDVSFLLLFNGDGVDVGDYCSGYGAIHHGDKKEGQERDVIRYREHFDRFKIRDIVHAFTFVRRGAAGPTSWTSGISLKDMRDRPMTRAAIDALFAEGDRTLREGGVDAEKQPRAP
jgi:methylase of polypeptide subunit release factors